MPLSLDNLKGELQSVFGLGVDQPPELSYDVIGLALANAYGNYVVPAASDGVSPIDPSSVNLAGLQQSLKDALTPEVVDGVAQGKSEAEAADLWSQGVLLYWLAAKFGANPVLNLAAEVVVLKSELEAEFLLPKEAKTLVAASGGIANRLHAFTTSLKTSVGTVV